MLSIIMTCFENFSILLVAEDDLVEHPRAVPESVGHLDSKTMQQHIEKGVVTSGRGKGKMSSKRMFQNPMLSFYKYITPVYTQVFFFCSHGLMKSNIGPLVIIHQFTESLMISFVVKMQWCMLVLVSFDFILHVG